MSPRGRNGWTVLCAALVTVIAGVDAAVGGALVVITLLSAGPLLASVRLGTVRTAVLAAYAIAAGVLLGIADGHFATEEHVLRVGILTVICAGAVWAAHLSQRLRASHDLLEAILENVADGVTAQDRSGALVFANQAAVRAVGLRGSDEMLATPPGGIVERFALLDEQGRPLDPDRLPGRRALRGEAPEPTLIRYRPADGGPDRWSVVKATPLRNEAGDVEMAISVIEDVTERVRAERGERFLSESSKLLASSLDYGTTLRRVADLAVREIADWCGVDVLDNDNRLDRVALGAAERRLLPLVNELRERYPPDPTDDVGPYKVVRTGQSELYPEIPAELLRRTAHDERHLEVLESLGLSSAMIVPMIARGRTLGAISFVAADPARRYDEEDLALAEELARRAAVAVDNARLFTERTYIAHALQESLLPPALPEIPGLELAARFRAAGEGNEVGGDFYDVFDTGRDGRWAVVIGDVCGKGAPAAAVTALARYTLRASAMRDLAPSAVLRELNEAMIRQHPGDDFCTAAFARLRRNGDGAHLTLSCAGHPLPLVLRADGSVESAGASGTLLGVTPEPRLEDATLYLRPGDAVVLYTDGVTDARAPDRMLTPRDLADVLHGCAGHEATRIAERLERAAVAPVDGEDAGVEPRDDVAILVLRVPPAG